MNLDLFMHRLYSGQFFDRLSRAVAEAAGRPSAFMGALALVLLWLISGPFMGWSDTWQLLINTPTTVITFLMVFILQATNNRDQKKIMAQLSELGRAVPDAEDVIQG